MASAGFRDALSATVRTRIGEEVWPAPPPRTVCVRASARPPSSGRTA